MYLISKKFSAFVFVLMILSGFAAISIAATKGDETVNVQAVEPTSMEREYHWGPDSVQAVRCHSIYRGDMQIDNILEAYPFWKCNYDLAPASTLHIYVDGVRILREKINIAELDAEKEAYIDTLMMLYDDRIRYFGNDGYVLGRKGLDMLRFRPSQLEKSFEMLDKSIAIQKNETEHTIPQTYMMLLTRFYRSENISKEEYIKKYQKVNDIINYNINADENFIENWLQLRDNVQQIVSRVLDCKDLIDIYTLQYNSAKGDVSLLKIITDALENNRCTNNELYHKAALDLFKIEPNARLAAHIANEMLAKNNNEAINYFNKAIKLEEDKANTAQYHLQIASVHRNNNNFRQAKESALEAVKTRPDWGLPHIFIGTLYILGADDGCLEGDEFMKQVIYIIAVKKYQYAKSIDPAVAKEADDLTARYSKHFPESGAAFFRGFSEGDIIEIACWINESVNLRLRQ